MYVFTMHCASSGSAIGAMYFQTALIRRQSGPKSRTPSAASGWRPSPVRKKCALSGCGGFCRRAGDRGEAGLL